MTLRFRPVAAAALALALPLSAQGSDPLELIPRDALLVGWAEGPALLNEKFADTRLARMLGGPELSSMLTPMIEQMRAEFEQGAEDSGLDAAAVEEILTGYEGRIVFAMGADFEAEEFDLEEAGMWMAWVMASDGSSDLETLAVALRDLAEDEAADDLRDITVEGKTYRVAHDPDIDVTLPIMHEGHLVVIAGQDIEKAIPACLAASDDSLADRQVPLPGGSLGVWLDFGHFMKLIDTAAAADPDGAPVTMMFEALGLNSLKSFGLTVNPAGEHLALEIDVQMGDGGHGILEAFMQPGGPPAILDLVPVQRGTWSVSRMDVGALYESIAAGFDAIGDQTGMSWADVEGKFEEMFRLRLKQDLIDHVGDGLLTVGAGEVDPGADPDDPATGVEGACYAVALTDPKSFGESFEKLLRSRGLHAARKTDDYRGFKVRRLTIMVEIHYAITDRLFLVAVGEAGGRELRAVLDEERDRSQGKARADFPSAVEDRLDHSLKGWQGIGVTSVPTVTEQMVTAIISGMEAEGIDIPFAAAMQQGVAMFGQLAVRYGLETMISLTKASSNQMRVQLVW